MEDIAKEFKADPKAAEMKYKDADLQLTGAADIVIGSGKDSELVQKTKSGVTVREATDNRPNKFPAKFTATAKFKSYFELGTELSLTASKLTYDK